MKKSNVLLNCVAKAAQHSAKKAVNSASIWSCYQPKEPQAAERNRSKPRRACGSGKKRWRRC